MGAERRTRRTKPAEDEPTTHRPQRRRTTIRRSASIEAALAQSPALVQRSSLRVGPADDRFEREADAVADEVLTRLGSAAPAAAPTGAARVQRSAIGPAGGALDRETGDEIERRRGGGAPMTDDVRRRMETGFGTDLGHVRIHTGPEASRLNEKMQARAFTTGSDVFLHDTAPRAGTAAGDHLLAHELAHTVQQSGGRVQRAAVVRRALDPNTPDAWPDDGVTIEIMTGGSANYGLFKLSDGNDVIVVKFEEEDSRRAAMSEQVLSAAGVGNAETNALKIADAQGVIAYVRGLAAAARVAGDETLAAGIEAKLAQAGTEARFVSIMKYVPGGDLGQALYGNRDRNVLPGEDAQQPQDAPIYKLKGTDAKLAHWRQEKATQEAILADGAQQEAHAAARDRLDAAEQQIDELTTGRQKLDAHIVGSGLADDARPTSIDVAKFRSIRFVSDLGRMMVADAVAGNADRLAIVTHGEDADAVTTLNANNFKVIAGGAIGAIDNDAVLFSRGLLGVAAANRAGGAPAPSVKNWVGFLVGGSFAHVDADPNNLRPTQGVAMIFDPQTKVRLYDKLVDEIGYNLGLQPAAVTAALPRGFFDQHFDVGVAAALAGIRAQRDALVASAAQLGGDDAGAGVLDPDALRVNLAYIENRMANANHLDPAVAHKEAVTAATKAGYESATGQTEVPELVAALQALTVTDPKLANDFPPFVEASFVKKAKRKGRRKISGESEADSTAEAVKGWARGDEARSVQDIDDVSGQLDELEGADAQRVAKARWALAHLRLVTAVREKEKAVRTTFNQVHHAVQDWSSAGAVAAHFAPLVAQVRAIKTRMQFDVLGAYEYAEALERGSVKAPKIGKNPAAKELAETKHVMDALRYAMANLETKSATILGLLDRVTP